jgi:AcrR family transcriptional regulator
MATSDRRERQKRELREKILDAARDLFVRDGYDAVSMKQIADAIEYSQGTLYFYFRDKEALFRELVGHDFREHARAFQKIASVADPLARLKKSAQVYADFAVAYPNHYRLLFMTAHGPGGKDDELETPEQNSFLFLRQTIAEAIKAGLLGPAFRDADTVAEACWAAIHGVVALHLTMPDRPGGKERPLPHQVAFMSDLLVRGLSAR